MKKGAATLSQTSESPSYRQKYLRAESCADERRLWSKGASTQAACGALLTRIVQWRPVCTRFLVLLGMVLLLGVVSASGGGDPGGGDYYSNWRVHITERSAGAGSVCTIAVQLYDGDTQHDTSEFATQSSASGAYNGARPSANYGSQNPTPSTGARRRTRGPRTATCSTTSIVPLR